MFGKKKDKLEEQKPVEVKDDNARIQQAYYEAFTKYKVYTPEFAANNISAVKDVELLNLLFALFIEVKRLNMKMEHLIEAGKQGGAQEQATPFTGISEETRIY